MIDDEDVSWTCMTAEDPQQGEPVGDWDLGVWTGTTVTWIAPMDFTGWPFLTVYDNDLPWDDPERDPEEEARDDEPEVTATVQLHIYYVHHIEWNSPEYGWVGVADHENGGTLYLHPGEQAAFRAAHNPDPSLEFGFWPDGFVEWGGDAGASGVHETVQIVAPLIGECYLSATLGNSVVLTIRTIAVQEIVWEKYSDNLDLETDATGKRIYPDKKTYQDTWSEGRLRVYATAKINVEEPGVPVYFTWWDVDDPSATGFPLDRTPDVGGPIGMDNRDSSLAQRLNYDVVETDEYGFASVILTVTMRPGDNFKVAATTYEDHHFDLNQAQVDGRADLPSTVVLSPLLTVWRKLHVESDRMQADVLNTNRHSGMVFNKVAEGNNWRLDLGGSAPVDFDTPDHFHLGQILIEGQTSPIGVIESRIPFLWVVIGVDVDPWDRMAFILADDDHDNTMAMKINHPTALTLAWLDERLAKVYVKPQVHNGTGDVNIEFMRNQTPTTFATMANTDFFLKNYASSRFWAIHAISAHQGDPDRDRDPDNERFVVLGNAQPSTLTFATYLEAIRDFCRDSPSLQSLVRSRNEVHEVAHLFGAKDNEGGVMNSGRFQETYYAPLTKHKIRTNEPGTEPY
jgi:hypothetical protein